MACRGQGAPTMVTPDPSPIDCLLVRKSSMGNGMLPNVGSAAWGGVVPDLHSENFDQSFLIDSDNSNNSNETDGSWDSEKELSDLDSFP